MGDAATWGWGQMIGCDPGITVYVAGEAIDPFALNPAVIFPFDELEVLGPPDRSARFVTWIFDPDRGAPDIQNTEAFALAGGTRGVASDLIPLAGPSWP